MRPRLEAQLEPPDDAAVERQRPRRPDDALGAAAVRRREDLFGRHVGDVGEAVEALRLGSGPAGLGQQPDRQVGAAAVEVQRVEPASRSARGARRSSRATCSRQAATGSSSSSRMQVSTAVPEPLDVRLAEHLARPALVRAGDDGPVVQPLVQLAHRSRRRARASARGRRARRGDRRGDPAPRRRSDRDRPPRSRRRTSARGRAATAASTTATSSGACSIIARRMCGSL